MNTNIISKLTRKEKVTKRKENQQLTHHLKFKLTINVYYSANLNGPKGSLRKPKN
jgi:hypothetical protein